MTLAVFGGRGNVVLFSSIVLSFIFSQTVLFAYGFVTEQLGFILIPVYQLFLTLITYIYINNSTVEFMGDIEDEDYLVSVYRERFDDIIAVPKSLLDSDKHYMFGGNFAYTSDSRFPSKAPIKIFDRVENRR